jgi:hypothetical protein
MPAILKESLPNLLASLLYSQSYARIGVTVGSSPPGLIVCSTPNRLTVCAWFGPWPHSLDSLAYMRPLASWSLPLDSSGVFGLVGVCITNPYRIPCPPCERAWCIWFGPHAAYQSLPHSTCKTTWFLVWSGRPLPGVTIHYHASVLSLHRSATFTIHHLRPDTQTDTHIEHTRIEHSTEWHTSYQSEYSGRGGTAQHSRHSTNHTGWSARRHTPHGSSALERKKRKT